MTLYLRRFAGEAITVTAAAVVALVELDDAGDEGDPSASPAGLYRVDLIGEAAVVPVDWRRFSRDDEFVAGALAQCVRDNFGCFSFEPVTAELVKRFETVLNSALADLQSIADPVHATFESTDEGRVLANVYYESKTGERKNLYVALNPQGGC